MATARYRKNNITKFRMLNRREISDHTEKATVLWDAFNDILGQTCPVERFLRIFLISFQ